MSHSVLMEGGKLFDLSLNANVVPIPIAPTPESSLRLVTSDRFAGWHSNCSIGPYRLSSKNEFQLAILSGEET
jgi:hypothetical protein